MRNLIKSVIDVQLQSTDSPTNIIFKQYFIWQSFDLRNKPKVCPIGNGRQTAQLDAGKWQCPRKKKKSLWREKGIEHSMDWLALQELNFNNPNENSKINLNVDPYFQSCYSQIDDNKWKWFYSCAGHKSKHEAHPTG